MIPQRCYEDYDPLYEDEEREDYHRYPDTWERRPVRAPRELIEQIIREEEPAPAAALIDDLSLF